MRFYVVSWPKDTPPPRATFPCCLLTKQAWDDGGFRTLYDLRYYRSAVRATHCGYVKILRRGKGSPELSGDFTELGADHCSLGQSVEYYRSFAKLGADVSAKVLVPLQDILVRPEHGQKFTGEPSFQKSLLRESEASTIWNDGKPSGEVLLRIKRSVDFRLICRLPDAVQDHEVEFRFGDGDGLPDRLMALIGKNGTGKTQILRILADAISTDAESAKLEPKRPGFTRVLAVSYSAFDHFRRPHVERRGSYEYCGIYDQKGTLLSPKEQIALTQRAVDTIREFERTEIWEESIKVVLGESGERMIELLSGGTEERAPEPEAHRLSSGELLLLVAFSRIVASIQPQSLILLDEPELHLHPNAISGLVQVIAKLLNQFNSHAVVATHSPLVLQQIPSRYVRVLGRQGNRPTVRKLPIECFGENLTAITEQIFFAQGEGAFYRQVLTELARTRSAEQVDAMFDRGLSLNALTLVESVQAENADAEE